MIPFFDFLPFRNPSREEFAERVLTALEKAGTDKKYLYDPAEFRITNGSRVVELADMYAMYCATPPLQRKARLSELAIAITQAAEELPADFASAKSRLVPTLRSPIEAAFLTLRSGAPWKNIVRPLGISLVSTIVLDSPNSTSTVAFERLADWGVSEDEVWAAAMHNLRNRAAGEFAEAAPGVFRSQWLDRFDAARILLPDMLRHVTRAAEPLAMIPNRDLLLLTGNKESGALAAMVKLGLRAYDESPYFLIPDVLEMEGDNWRVRPLTPELQAEIDMRKRSQLHQDYAEQKRLLDEVAHGGIFNAPFAVLNTRRYGPLTAATWKASPALLPEAELVALLDPASNVVIAVKWEDVLAVIGPLVPEPDLLPRRYRVAGFPDAEQLAELRQHIIESY